MDGSKKIDSLIPLFTYKVLKQAFTVAPLVMSLIPLFTYKVLKQSSVLQK